MVAAGTVVAQLCSTPVGSTSPAARNDGALTFNQGGNGTYAGLISGTGTLTKLGAGAVTLSANNTCTGNDHQRGIPNCQRLAAARARRLSGLRVR